MIIQRKNKYFWLIWVLIVLSGLFPVNISSLLNRPSDDDLVITSQECGCPCPNARVLSGNLIIPKEILIVHPNIRMNELNLIGNSPFKPYHHEIGLSDILIEGKIVGIDTLYCSPSDCEVVPRFEVEKWRLLSYSAVFWSWNKTIGIIYLIGIPISFFILVVLTSKSSLKE